MRHGQTQIKFEDICMTDGTEHTIGFD